MKQFTKVLRMTPAVMLLALFVVAPVYAQHGADDTAATTAGVAPTATTGTESESGTTSSGSGSTTVRTTTTTKTEDNDQTLRSKAEQEVADLKKDHQEHKAADRQKFCNLHKDSLEGRFHGLDTSAQAIQKNIDAVYAKAVAFKTDKSLTVANYDALVAAADAAKATAASDIANLTPPALDCSSTTVATDVATFKVSAQQVRTDLKTYRDAVKSLVKAIKAAAEAAAPSSTTATGGTN